MPNPILERANGSLYERAQQVRDMMRDPGSMFRQMIPPNMNDPDQIMNMLVRSGRATPEMVQQARQAAHDQGLC